MKKYEGKIPTLNSNQKIINGLAYFQCYPFGTPEKKYRYKTGKPRVAYKKGIDKIYPNHMKWPNHKQRVGACCDIYVGECSGQIGIKLPKDLADQLVVMPKMTEELRQVDVYRAKDFRGGMICQRGRKDKSGHTWIVFEDIHGNRYVANSHYKKLGGTYAVLDAKPKNIVKSKWAYYKVYVPTGAIRTWYGLNDYGYDVLYIQEFLKWKGLYKGALDGWYGEKTEAAVNAYQKKQGWKPCGRVGENTIARMKKEAA